jgi:hypothetical protein
VRQQCPKRSEVAPRRRRGAIGSDFGVLGKGKRVFHVDSEIAHRVLDLAMTEKNLDRTKVSSDIGMNPLGAIENWPPFMIKR